MIGPPAPGSTPGPISQSGVADDKGAAITSYGIAGSAHGPVTFNYHSSRLDAAPAPVRVVRNLRADTPTFTGRDDQILEITQEATKEAPGKVVAIYGMPGVGKTALATHAAHRLVDRYPDGHLFVDLHAYSVDHTPTDPADILASLLSTSGLAPEHIPTSVDERAALWRDRLAERRLLLIFDNAATAEQVAPLLPGTNHSLVLVTSRRRLARLRRDYGATLLPLGVLPEHDAVQLFNRVCPRRLDSAQQDAVVEATRLCGWLPLAVAVLASSIEPEQTNPVHALISELAEAQDRLACIDEHLDDRDRGVASAIALSYQRLTTDQQRVLRLIAATPGIDVDLYAAAALTDLPLLVVRRHLRDLHTHRLVDHSTGLDRHRLHDLIAAYARAQANPTEYDQAVSRLLEYYQHTATGAAAQTSGRAAPPRKTFAFSASSPEPDLPDQTQALKWLRTERANLLGCLAHTRRRRDHARTVDLAACIAPLLRKDGPWVESIDLHTDILTIVRDLGDREGEAYALSELGVLRQGTGDYPQSAFLLERALAMRRELGDRFGEAWVLGALGRTRREGGNFRQAITLQELALSIRRELGDRQGEWKTLQALGTMRQLTGDYPQATTLFEQALTISEELGDRNGEARALGGLAALHRLTGDYPQATVLLEKASTINQELGDQLDHACDLGELGVVRRLTGDYPQATTLLEQALTTFREFGDQQNQAATLSELGTIRRLTGDYPQASTLLEQALTTFREIGDQTGVLEALNCQGDLLYDVSSLEQASARYGEALHIARQLGAPLDEARALAGVGRCAVANNDAAGVSDLRRALAIFQRIGSAEAVPLMNELEAMRGRSVRLCPFLGESE